MVYSHNIHSKKATRNPFLDFPDNNFDQPFSEVAEMSPFEYEEKYEIDADPHAILMRIGNDAGYNYA